MEQAKILDVDFGSILLKLHGLAADAVGKTGVSFRFDNTLFDARGQTLFGSGENVLAAIVDDGRELASDMRSRLYGILQEYLRYFAGENFSSMLHKEHLQDIIQINEPIGANLSTDNTNEKQNLAETFITRMDRNMYRDINLLFEATDAEDERGTPIGIGVGYTFQIQAGNIQRFANVIQKRGGDFLGGKNLDQLEMTGMGGTLANPKKFNSCMTITSQGILTNLHDSAATKAARKLGIKVDRNINQFVVNTGMTDDGSSISDKGQTINRQARFGQSGALEAGVIIELGDTKPVSSEKDESKVDELIRANRKAIIDSKNRAFQALREYFMWFAGAADFTQDDIQMFIPSYSGGRVQIRDGAIVQPPDKDEVLRAFISRNAKEAPTPNLRIGFGIGYSLKYR